MTTKHRSEDRDAETNDRALESIDGAQLAAATGGINWGSVGDSLKSVGDSLKPYLPPNGPTIPLGPYTPTPNLLA